MIATLLQFDFSLSTNTTPRMYHAFTMHVPHMYPQAVVTGVDLSPYFLAVGTYENSKRMVRTEDLGWV